MCELLDAVDKVVLLEAIGALNRSHSILQNLEIKGSQSELVAEAKNNIGVVNNRLVKLKEDVDRLRAGCSQKSEEPAAVCGHTNGQCSDNQPSI